MFVKSNIKVGKNLTMRSRHRKCPVCGRMFDAKSGNITVVGSTANIVASGLLEKHGYHPIKFKDWIKIGAFVGVVSGVVAWVMLLIMPVPKPEAASTADQAQTTQVQIAPAEN